MELSRTQNAVLIVAITPYFLEKGNVWFEENLQKILGARKTQAFFQDNTVYIEVGAELGLSPLLRKLDELGYEKVLEVRDMGEFSHRGGVVDLFSLTMDHAVRVEFIGNRVDTIEQLPVSVENEKRAKDLLKKRLKSQKLYSDLKGLREGDYVVHLDHGVGKFVGLSTFGQIEYTFNLSEYYSIEYAAGDKLFVPAGLERKLSRYIGFTDPKIARLGSPIWQRTKRKAKEEIEKLARELLQLYAERETAERPAYASHEAIEQRLQSTFPYQETPDQIQALLDIAQDLAKKKPMDRIVCGDVGFGKTEVALRTMVHAAHNGYQAALLAPTTILARQHYQNFKERLENLPVRVEMLTRLQTKNEQLRVLEKLREGAADLVISTHRLLSRDVAFKNLGLLVIDDEQRFGVKQKEKLKGMRASLDVLALSATPIPRTLYMALSSLKKISMIQTPPEGRLPVKTAIVKRKNSFVKGALEKELKRNGQIYYLHNRIGTIERAKNLLRELAPKASVAVAHGRMQERQLISAIDGFRAKKFDILLATTIIENGLDLPNVGTIIVEDATKLGLSQAYQIRGRVGRSNMQSFAYFLYGGKLGEKAKLRLEALKEAEELGSGYRIAMRDLEIRGAGNILGKEQAGSVNAVGLNLYCQMLGQAVEKLKDI